MARENGELIDWNDERGFGFIRNRRDEQLFVHISSIEPAGPRPRMGDRVTFERGPGRDGKPAAIGVKIAGADRRGPDMGHGDRLRSRQGGLNIRFILSATIGLLALAVLGLGALPYWLVAIYPVMGVVSAVLYGLDKARAQNGEWRISEANLQLADLCGGIVGGLLAQQLFRHKTAKPFFATISFATAGAHILVLAALCMGLLPIA